MYVVFAGSRYYPRGGAADARAVFATEQEALDYTEHSLGRWDDWWQIALVTASSVEMFHQGDGPGLIISEEIP